MGNVHDNGIAELLHLRNTPIIDNQVRISECSASFRNHDVVISGIGYFLYGKLHGSRREELSFFDIDNFPCLGSSYQQVRLPAEESRDLQDIHILGSHCSFSCFVNIGYSRNTERVAYPAEYFQCFLIANACERIQPRTVGFPV